MFLKLPFYNPKITIKDLISSFFLKSPQKELTSDLQNYFNSENILLLKSARQGIKFILEGLNLKEKDEVIVPSFICSVVPEAVIRAGARPVFCDVEKNGLNMDAELAEKLISPWTKAIIVAHIFGIPVQIEKFIKLAKDNNLILIEDCAQAFGAKYKGKALGTFGDFGVFSFGISKNFGGLGGGFLYSQNKENFQKVKKYVLKTEKSLFSFKKYFEFFLIPLVFNRYFYWLFNNFVEKYAKIRREEGNNKEFSSSISNLEAKIALQKLKHYDKNKQERNKNAFIYQQELKNLFSFPKIPDNSEPALTSFPVLASRGIFEILKTKNIPVRKLDFDREVQKNYFLLPLNYSSNKIKQIVNQIKKVLESYVQ